MHLCKDQLQMQAKCKWCCPHSVYHIESQTLPGDRSVDVEKAFSEELALMVKLSTGQNPHIVKLIGCITNQSPVAVLLELAPYGDLCSYLRTQRKAVGFKTESEVRTGEITYNQHNVCICILHDVFLITIYFYLSSATAVDVLFPCRLLP